MVKGKKKKMEKRRELLVCTPAAVSHHSLFPASYRRRAASDYKDCHPSGPPAHPKDTSRKRKERTQLFTTHRGTPGKVRVRVRMRSLTAPQRDTQSSGVLRKLLGSNGCQKVKMTGVWSVHWKSICMFVSWRPIQSCSTSDGASGLRRKKRSITGCESVFDLGVCPQKVTPISGKSKRESPFFMVPVMNSSSGRVWMLTRLASIFWQVF